MKQTVRNRRKRSRSRRRIGGASKCQTHCKHSCPTQCRTLCNIAKHDKFFQQEELKNLLVIKEELKQKILAQNQQKIENILKKEQYSDSERENLRKLLTSDTVNVDVKKLVLDNVKNSSRHLFQRGGYGWLLYKKKNTECEKDCTAKCSDSCDFLCKESVNKKAGAYNKEYELLSLEVDLLRNVLSQVSI